MYSSLALAMYSLRITAVPTCRYMYLLITAVASEGLDLASARSS